LKFTFGLAAVAATCRTASAVDTLARLWEEKLLHAISLDSAWGLMGMLAIRRRGQVQRLAPGHRPGANWPKSHGQLTHDPQVESRRGR
jgi:hypothetical protein